MYAEVFSKTYNIEIIGIRYFNVFEKRQDSNGLYAAVIPRWLNSMKENKTVTIYEDGLTSRDFCHIENVVQMNLLASISNQEYFIIVL